MKYLLCSISLLMLTSCAAGSLTAGYSARANVAESLTAEAEQKIVDRSKREVFIEMKANGGNDGNHGM